MPGEPIKVGPFVGGLNTFSDNSAVSDNDLVECLNFEPDLDGSLKSRPPIVLQGSSITLGATGNARIIGKFLWQGDSEYLIASDGLSSTYYFFAGVWTLITGTFAASAMTQFDDKAWMLAPVGSANPGGSWSPTAGFVANANMPKGDVIVSNKQRLWVAAGKDSPTNGTRLYFSKVLGQPDFWEASNGFIDVGSGDGQNIVNAAVYYQSILLFRSNSIYQFSYTTDPANGVVNVVVPGVGLSHRDAFAIYENYIYFIYQNRAYEFINSRAQQINIKVTLEALTMAENHIPTCVSIFNERVLFQWYDTTYVFYLKTRTWTRWRSTERNALGKCWEVLNNENIPEILCFSSTAIGAVEPRTANTLSVRDGLSSARVENFECTMQTKNYDYEAATIRKRLFMWFINASFNGVVTGSAAAINFTEKATWGQLAASTWGTVQQTFSWGTLASDTYIITSTVDTSGSGFQRRTVKLRKSLRFKEIYYRVTFNTDGTPNTAPVTMNSLMTYVRAKQTLTKTVS